MGKSLSQQMDEAFMRHVAGWVSQLNQFCEDETIATVSDARHRVRQFFESDGGSIDEAELDEFAKVVVAEGGHFKLKGQALVGVVPGDN